MSSTRKTPEHLGPAYSLSEEATVAGVTVAATAAAITGVTVAATAAAITVVTVAATAAAITVVEVAITVVEVAVTAAATVAEAVGVGGAAAEAVEAVETAGYGPPLVGFGPAIDNVFSKGAGNVGPLLMGIIAR